jgi:radical SAM superfamily enzyme YgiQ (UPF0313 family)
MKIIIVTTPLRDVPCTTPPWGSLSIMSYLQKHGDPDIQIDFYNIDAHRPTFDDTLKHIQENNPDILAISAVVSTAYDYTKRLTQGIKKLLPNIKVVVGGNLCASAEVLLHKADVDICVLGEGEIVFLNLVNHYKTGQSSSDLNTIPGIAFLNENGKMVNTGYEKPLPADQIWDVDWNIIEQDNTIDLYFPVVSIKERAGRNISRDDHRFDAIKEDSNLRMGVLACAKGCIARCTFCHRWDKGIRHIPVDKIMQRLDYIIDRYNVGIVTMAAESFGASRKWLNEFLDRVEPYNLLWMAGGVRTSTVDPEIIKRMKDTGCYSLIYGNETGSAKMMEIMEKKVSIEDNYNAAKWTAEAGLANTIQLVIGMPGETLETIKETIEYCQYASSLTPDHDPRLISINYAQALPGTPLYEFARTKKLINPTMDGEDEYLTAVSDKDAADPITCINFTDSSRLALMSWHLLIRVEVRYYHQKKYGKENYAKILIDDETISHLPSDVVSSLKANGTPSFGLFVNLLFSGRASVLLACYPQFFHYTQFLIQFYTLLNIVREYNLKSGWVVLKDSIIHMVTNTNKTWKYQYRSLRKIVKEDIEPLEGDNPEMMPLRKGR